MNAPHTYQLAMLGLTAVAAGLDWRTGKLPNWLTLGAFVAAFPLHAWLSQAGGAGTALDGLKWSALGATVCTLPVLLGWQLGWVAGGDVKLVAAMGATGGLTLGVETVFLALLAAASFVALSLAWRGNLLAAASDGLSLVASRTPLRKHVLPARAPTSSLRFGPFALAGAGISFALHGGFQ
jgi:prepilin peptidase CpaA